MGYVVTLVFLCLDKWLSTLSFLPHCVVLSFPVLRYNNYFVVLSDEEEIEQKKEERKRRGQDPNWDVILNQTKASPLMVSRNFWFLAWRWFMVVKFYSLLGAPLNRLWMVTTSYTNGLGLRNI